MQPAGANSADSGQAVETLDPLAELREAVDSLMVRVDALEVYIEQSKRDRQTADTKARAMLDAAKSGNPMKILALLSEL